ncbi:hypothetical protein F511_36981 [Dorcoceras hygrometricum]|uniref:Uncharacterized protein n=1 Tax=Dorcoceras hygrometricum TaxID=472368 RepID=A0A2Z7B5T7_9LAMI|nr:hypothetical protein F511_36981 [Dorcoceras hygrometricum]
MRSAPAHHASGYELQNITHRVFQRRRSPFSHHPSLRPELHISRGGVNSAVEKIWLHQFASSRENEKRDKMPPRRSRLQETGEKSRTERIFLRENPNLTTTQIPQLRSLSLRCGCWRELRTVEEAVGYQLRTVPVAVGSCDFYVSGVGICLCYPAGRGANPAGGAPSGG